MAYVYNDITESGIEVSSFENGMTVATSPTRTWWWKLPSNLLFVRALDYEGGVLIIGKGGAAEIGGRTILLSSFSPGGWADLGPNHGNEAHGLWRDPATNIVYAVYVTVGGTVWQPLNGTLGEVLPFPWPYVPSTGFLDIVSYGVVLWTHEHRSVALGGIELYLPLSRGDWTVGLSTGWLGVGAYQHSSGKMFVAWEGDTQVQARINSAGKVAVSATPDRPLFVAPPYQEYVPLPAVAPYTMPKLVGTIWANSDRYGYHRHNGNAETFFEGDYGQVIDRKPVILGPATNVPPNKILGVWSTAELDPETNFPIFRYWDGRVYEDDPRFREGVDVRLFQAYPNPGESPSAFQAAIEAQLNRFGGKKMIVAAFYDRNGTLPIPELLQYMHIYDALLRRPDVLGLLAFDYARSGILFHPALLSWYNAFCAATPGLPAFPPKSETKMNVFMTVQPAAGQLIPGQPTPPLRLKHLGERVNQPDGSFAIKKSNGNWLTLTPEGRFEERPGTPENVKDWEKFRDGKPGGTVAQRGAGNDYLLETVTV